jgi:Flp pilus assembly protein TadD, contains TPR repeats
LRKTIEMDPRFYYAHRRLGEVLQLTGRLDDAIAEYRKAVELNDDPSVLALLGQAYARAGQREEAQRILVRLNEEARLRYVSAYSFALIFLALGDKERAIDEIERAYRERAGEDIDLIKVDQCSTISAATRASRLSCKKSSLQKNEGGQFFQRTKTPQCLQSCDRLRSRRMAAHADCDAGFPVPRDSKLGNSARDNADCDWFSNCPRDRVGI